MASRLSKEALNWLRSFIEGEEESCDAKILAELKSFAVSKSEPLFRGLFFDTKENFLEKMKIESGAKSFSFSYKALESFTDSEDVAESFAKDIESNFGVVLELQVESLVLDVSQFPEVLEDFDHEQEFLVLESGVAEAKIISTFENMKKSLGLS